MISVKRMNRKAFHAFKSRRDQIGIPIDGGYDDYESYVEGRIAFFREHVIGIRAIETLYFSKNDAVNLAKDEPETDFPFRWETEDRQAFIAINCGSVMTLIEGRIEALGVGQKRAADCYEQACVLVDLVATNSYRVFPLSEELVPRLYSVFAVANDDTFCFDVGEHKTVVSVAVGSGAPLHYDRKESFSRGGDLKKHLTGTTKYMQGVLQHRLKVTTDMLNNHTRLRKYMYSLCHSFRDNKQPSFLITEQEARNLAKACDINIRLVNY